MHCNYCYANLGKPHMSSCRWPGLVNVVHCNRTSSEETPMDPQKVDLQQQGRRYDHYMELKEWAMTGIDVIERSRLANEGDKRTKAKLEAFVEVLDRRMRYLADYDSKVFAVNRAIDAAGIHRTPALTTGATDDKPAQTTSEHSSLPPELNQTDLGDVTAA